MNSFVMTRILLTFFLILRFLGCVSAAFPTCRNEDDLQLEESCDSLARRGDGGLTWATFDLYRILAFWDSLSCDGDLAGVRCLTGDGFTSYRYNVWECQDDCTPSTE